MLKCEIRLSPITNFLPSLFVVIGSSKRVPKNYTINPLMLNAVSSSVKIFGPIYDLKLNGLFDCIASKYNAYAGFCCVHYPLGDFFPTQNITHTGFVVIEDVYSRCIFEQFSHILNVFSDDFSSTAALVLSMLVANRTERWGCLSRKV